MSFPRTKIEVPQPRPGTLVARPALQSRLGAALRSQRLVLLCAAAGFGKTAALAQQVQQLPAGTALTWVSCDEGDTAGDLLECLVAALEPYDPPWRTAPEALVAAAAEAATPALQRSLAHQLIQALDACDVPHGVMVFDDLHRCTDPRVASFFDLLLERLTPRWTLVLATRSEPALALARLRAHEALAEFRHDDLRLARDEARALGAAAQVAPEMLDALYERAQGWAVGLRLALKAAASGAAATGAAGIDRHAFDYLTAEVIAPLDPALRDFLLASSVLPELSAERCAALTGDPQAALRLEEIERGGLFATVVGGREGGTPVLRLHDLFREALQARLQREQPQRLAELLQRAADTEPDTLRRVGWLQRAQAWDAAARVLSDAAEALILDGLSLAVRDALSRFPPALMARHAGLLMVRSKLAWMLWDWAAGLEASAGALAAAQAAGDTELALSARSYQVIAMAGSHHHQLDGTLAALMAEPQLSGGPLCRALVASAWADLWRSDQQLVARHWQRLLPALESLEGPDSLARWLEATPLPYYVGLPGMRAPLQRYIAGALRRLPDSPTPLRAICHVVQGWLQLFVGDLPAAQASADAAADDVRWLGRPVSADTFTRALQAVLLALRGQRLQALSAVDSLVFDIESSDDATRRRVYLPLYRFLALRCAALLDDDEALRVAAGRMATVENATDAWLSPQQMSSAAAHRATAAGDLDEACARWRVLLGIEHRADLIGQVVEARLRLADALLRRDRPVAEAAAVLGPAFARIESSGEWGAVLMAGPGVLARLAATAWGAALPPPLARRLGDWARAAAALRVSQPPSPADTAGPQPPQAAGLSPREAEVLARIAAGDSNKLIARAFDLSPHTVKRHVANILDKLALSSRGQAAAWWRDRQQA